MSSMGEKMIEEMNRAQGRCKTCKHWGPNRAERPISDNPKTGGCYSPKNCMDLSGVYESGIGAGIDSGVGYLLTGSNFGCVNWEGIGE